MPAPPQIRSSRDKDAAAVLVDLLKPGAWIPPAHVGWLPVIEALLEAFLRHFDGAVLARLDHQRALPPSVRSCCARGANGGGIDRFAQIYVRCWRGICAFQQRLARTRALGKPPAGSNSGYGRLGGGRSCRADAARFEVDPENPKIGRGSVGQCIPISGSNF